MPSTSYIDAGFAVGYLQDRTDAAGTDIVDVSGEELRLLASLFTPGVYQPDAFKVVPGTGLAVDVGDAVDDLAVVPGTDPGQGNYLFRQSTTPPQVVSLQAAHVSNPRLDEIYLVVLDQIYDGGTLTLGRIARRTGDAAASPTAPGPDAGWSAYLLLATVTVPAGAGSISEGNIADARSQISATAASRGAPGVVDMYAGPNAPAGALICDGSQVSRTTYARLFAAIGTTWGAGNGTTTFHLPDMRDRYPRGAGATALGAAVGADTLPNHAHSIAHTHAVDPPDTTSGQDANYSGLPSDPPPGYTPGGQRHSHSVNIASFNSGGSSAANSGNPTTNPSILPASRALHYIIWT